MKLNLQPRPYRVTSPALLSNSACRIRQHFRCARKQRIPRAARRIFERPTTSGVTSETFSRFRSRRRSQPIAQRSSPRPRLRANVRKSSDSTHRPSRLPELRNSRGTLQRISTHRPDRLRSSLRIRTSISLRIRPSCRPASPSPPSGDIDAGWRSFAQAPTPSSTRVDRVLPVRNALPMPSAPPTLPPFLGGSSLATFAVPIVVPVASTQHTWHADVPVRAAGGVDCATLVIRAQRASLAKALTDAVAEARQTQTILRHVVLVVAYPRNGGG